MRLTFFFIAITTLSVRAQSTTLTDSSQTIRFKVIKHSGNRPVIKARVNKIPIVFQLHSNADFSMQVSHKFADKSSIGERKHIGDYGISKAGVLSGNGLDKAFVDHLTISNKTYKHIPVSIFDTPSSKDIGMLGLRWLIANRTVINYQKKTITINPSSQYTFNSNKSLLQNGYVAIAMKRDTVSTCSIDVMVNGVSQPITISTVSHNTFDIEFAKRAQICYHKTSEKFAGPTGATGNVCRVNSPVAITIGKYSFLVDDAVVEDTYAYMKDERPADPSISKAGMLAADFLIENDAIVDFGTLTLYLKKY